MKVLAIIVLLATVAGAGAVLYGINTLTPQVEQTALIRTPAEDAQEVFDSVMAQLEENSFTGRLYGEAAGLSAQDCAFETYTVRLVNRGFFPAEWVALTVQPVQTEEGADVLQLGDSGAYVLGAGARGDISATVLTTLPEGAAQRALQVTCYVFGQKIEFLTSVQ